ncbi:Type II toxin-antitoxin system RelE/ParE family toxin [Acanthopleuribacter pedis]|uniref:Type II toxin-antitoxin system RelE/ParE family toxin n=2 Tax=Acanthopleuribacter pedis TaxID=442870 RepID=A0A8J7QCA1_9BACT|nr:type II toxin-antitoxin system RelE/ParE family toxin [Acanthopleuribacter pedis]
MRTITAYLAAKNPAAALEVVSRVSASIESLLIFPQKGRPAKTGSRELVIPKTSYIVPYRINGDKIELLHIFHTHRRPPRQWEAA